MKRNHRAQSLLFVSLYELCILVSALALSIEFNAAPSEKRKGQIAKKRQPPIALLDNR